MTTKHTPATPLPWQDQSHKDAGVVGTNYGNFAVNHPQDAAYIVHACNIYPRLVAALRSVEQTLSIFPFSTQSTIGIDALRALLRELGEDA